METFQVMDREKMDDVLSRLKRLERFRLEPMNGWVVIKKIVREEGRSEGNVTMAAEQRSSKGMVLAAAETDETGRPVMSKPGDLVIFTGFPTSLEDLDMLTGERDLFLVRHEEVYCKLVPCT